MSNVPESNDARLRDLLREARAMPTLPPRFRESVWRRVERAEGPAASGRSPLHGLERWLERLLAPRFAIAAFSFLLVAGGFTGVLTSDGAAKRQAQERYLASVAPSPLH